MADLKIWMNGNVVAQEEAVLPVNSAAVFYAVRFFAWFIAPGLVVGALLQAALVSFRPKARARV